MLNFVAKVRSLVLSYALNVLCFVSYELGLVLSVSGFVVYLHCSEVRACALCVWNVAVM